MAAGRTGAGSVMDRGLLTSLSSTARLTCTPTETEFEVSTKLAGRDKAMTQVLGAIAYGEWKAHTGAAAEAEAASDPKERKELRTIAAEELRHHKGFVRLLEGLGADPERAMRPYEGMLDRYHGRHASDELEELVHHYLGEGIADDLLTWLRTVVDGEAAEFVDSVIEDEVGHEARATELLKARMAETPGGRSKAGAAARSMLTNMALAGGAGATPLTAFLRLGNAPDLVRAIVGGYNRRLRALGLGPLGVPLPRLLAS